MGVGATEMEMQPVLQDIRHGQWRWDFAVASHGAFFHAPEETLRTLQKRFRVLPLAVQKQIVGFVTSLPQSQKLQSRPEMRELVEELIGL